MHSRSVCLFCYIKFPLHSTREPLWYRIPKTSEKKSWMLWCSLRLVNLILYWNPFSRKEIIIASNIYCENPYTVFHVWWAELTNHRWEFVTIQKVFACTKMNKRRMQTISRKVDCYFLSSLPGYGEFNQQLRQYILLGER